MIPIKLSKIEALALSNNVGARVCSAIDFASSTSCARARNVIIFLEIIMFLGIFVLPISRACKNPD